MRQVNVKSFKWAKKDFSKHVNPTELWNHKFHIITYYAYYLPIGFQKQCFGNYLNFTMTFCWVCKQNNK